MFKIEDIDPVYYRKKTRNATLSIMAMFIVIGFITASLAVKFLGDFSSNKLVLNFMGAFVGLLITAWVVKTFFSQKEWMKEAMYAWRLKRHLMSITNVLNPVQKAVENGDEQAMKTLRFYHLGLEQMHRLEDNNQALIDIIAEKRQLEETLIARNIDLNQYEFDLNSVKEYKNP